MGLSELLCLKVIIFLGLFQMEGIKKTKSRIYDAYFHIDHGLSHSRKLADLASHLKAQMALNIGIFSGFPKFP